MLPQATDNCRKQIHDAQPDHKTAKPSKNNPAKKQNQRLGAPDKETCMPVQLFGRLDGGRTGKGLSAFLACFHFSAFGDFFKNGCPRWLHCLRMSVIVNEMPRTLKSASVKIEIKTAVKRFNNLGK